MKRVFDLSNSEYESLVLNNPNLNLLLTDFICACASCGDPKEKPTYYYVCDVCEQSFKDSDSDEAIKVLKSED